MESQANAFETKDVAVWGMQIPASLVGLKSDWQSSPWASKDSRHAMIRAIAALLNHTLGILAQLKTGVTVGKRAEYFGLESRCGVVRGSQSARVRFFICGIAFDSDAGQVTIGDRCYIGRSHLSVPQPNRHWQRCRHDRGQLPSLIITLTACTGRNVKMMYAIGRGAPNSGTACTVLPSR